MVKLEGLGEVLLEFRGIQDLEAWLSIER
ncbi:DUF4351 domain-containing protein [Prochlorothrix hollandica]